MKGHPSIAAGKIEKEEHEWNCTWRCEEAVGAASYLVIGNNFRADRTGEQLCNVQVFLQRQLINGLKVYIGKGRKISLKY